MNKKQNAKKVVRIRSCNCGRKTEAKKCKGKNCPKSKILFI